MCSTSSASQSQPPREGAGQSREQISLPQHPLSSVLKSILGELQGLRAEIRKMKKKQGKLKNSFEEFAVKQFNIDSSPYKAHLLKELGKLFCRTINRQPSSADISTVINKVLGEEAEHPHKYKIAYSYSTTRLGELRAEERRRLFGIKPCEAYPTLDIELFVEKFKPILKISEEDVPLYQHHVAILRKYCRENLECQKSTYKGFSSWLSSTFVNGPTPAELEDIFVAESHSSLTPASLGTRAERSAEGYQSPCYDQDD